MRCVLNLVPPGVDFNAKEDESRKRKGNDATNESRDSVTNRRGVSKNMDMRSGNPHVAGGSRKKKMSSLRSKSQ